MDQIVNRNMSTSKGWTLQSSLLMLWMDEKLESTIKQKSLTMKNLHILFDATTKLSQIVPTRVIETGGLNR